MRDITRAGEKSKQEQKRIQLIIQNKGITNVTGYNVAVEQFNEMEVYNHITDWFRIEKRLRRGIWFRLCDGSDFFKNDYRTTRYGPHDLHSFGRGYRLISEKNDLHL